MNVKDYIATGILEAYCLGLLSEVEQEEVLKICRLCPKIKAELIAIQTAMEQMTAQRAIAPNVGLRGKILGLLGFPEPVKYDPDNLPATNAYSNHHSWLISLAHLIPKEPSEDFLCHTLQRNEQFAQMLVVTKLDVPEESHTDVMESFFILKGQCKCIVGDDTFMLTPGNFLDIPLYKKHNVELISPYVVAILQHQYV